MIVGDTGRQKDRAYGGGGKPPKADLTNQTAAVKVNASSETEAGFAGEQPVEG